MTGTWSGLEVAIVGMAGRFPGARDVAAFWKNLRAGVESIRVPTEAELEAAGVSREELRDSRYVRAVSILDDIDKFDAAFFGIPPREADLMDPQHRLFLECAWTALESAGYDPARCPGPVGVYGGASTNSYFLHNLLTNGRVDAGGLPTLFGNYGDYLTTRVSYKLNLKGPSFDVQTSCSSSLVAVHLACQALVSGECDVALAGGVGVMVPHGQGYLYQEQGIYSPDGHCRAFSDRAEGTVGGSGVGVVVLRRLADALESGDTILSVIKGSAINNDGSDKVGYAAPSIDGQRQVVASALAMADVHPETVTYVETHGTGTSLGDPIEVAALTAAFRAGTKKTGFCRIGSVKTNIGHLDTAAGVTGLIKATLALGHRELPPSLNCDVPDPKIDFQSTPFRVNTELTPWTADVRRAGVSSFGIGGTNAHVILEEAPEVEARVAVPGAQVLVLSARTEAALERQTRDLASHLRANPDLSLADVAHTLQSGRAELACRRSVAGRDAAEIAAALEASSSGGASVRTRVQETDDRSVVFLFPGQGAQYVDMGRELYALEPTFRAHVDRVAELLEGELGLDLRRVLYPEDAEREAAAEQLAQTKLTQPALFAIEVALAEWWLERGVRAAAMIGHSIGEYVAATLAGVFELADAARLVAARGRLMQSLPAGDMLAVPLTADEVRPMLGDALSLAAVNERASSVVSGPPEAIDAFEAALAARGVTGRRLHTSHAFHSAMMDPILAEFTELVRAARPKAPTIPFASNRTGTWITAAEATDPAYWAGHLRGTVRFAEGLETVLAGERRVLLEIGPGNTLTTLSSRIARGADAEPPVVVASMRHPRETERDHDRLMDAVGQLWLAHVRPDWAAVHRGEPRRRVPLPTYPFERSRHWIEPGNGPLLAGAAGAAGKTSDVASWFYAPSWKRAAPSVGRLELSAHDVLVVASGDDLGLAERLRALGKEVTTVDGAELSAHLAGRTNAPELVVHLLGAVRDDDGLETGLFSLLELAQAVVAAEWSTPIDVVVVTRGTQSVTGAETLFPEKAAVLAACQALSLETPNLTCRAIDVDGDTDPDAILRELGAGGAGVAGVAWRGRFRWTRAFEPLRVEAPDAGALPLRDGGHYLVTGGLGSIGLEVASTLARRARGARLVLVGRSPFPARADWDGWLAAHGDADDTSRRIAVLRSLEELGAQVRVVAADVTDRVRFARVVDEAEASFGALNGVVHAAGGEKTMAILAATTRVECEAQLRPKIAGLAVLEELLEGRTLDFCLVQSSLSSYLGALGMLGYVAAHHVVDAFVARHNRTSSQRWTSANWDNWLSWKEPEFLHTHGESAYFMTPEEGADALLRVLSLPPGTEVVVSTGSLEARLAEWARPARSESDRTGGDGASGGDLHARPALRTDWVAPTTPAELALARAWGEVLGIAEIGANDGFFELGGDSVLGLQIVAKVARAGFHVTPAQIFEHPTIAGLASVAQARQTERVVEGAVEGPAPLLPIQHWFFESDYPEPEHFNLPMLFEVPAGTTPEQLAEALAVVARHHDALRLRYRRTDAGVEQIHAAEAGAVDVSLLDLSNVAAPERADALRARADELHLGFDLEHGPLGRALLVRTGGEAPRVLWILHHLLVDVVSWRVLVEDVQAALASRPLPPKSTSYRRFGQALVEHAGSTAIERERAHWTALARIAPPRVPVDAAGARNVYASARTVTVSLDAERTRALLLDVPPVYETRIDEVLLAALALGFSRWSGGGGELFVDLEAHGRESVTPGLDLSRTVGWFTTLYPAHFVLPGDGRDLRETLRAIKEQVRRIPNHGVGFGVLRYLSPDAALREALRAIPKPELGFLYLGQFDAGGSGGPGGIGSSGMQVLEDASGRPCSPDAPRGHLLELACFVKGGRLEVELSYSTEHHERSSAEALTRAFVEELEALVAHCQDPEAGGRTPSDFPAARVSQASLDKLMSRIGRKPGG